MWSRQALTWLERFIDRHAVTPQQAALLQLSVEEGRAQLTSWPAGLLAAELPLQVFSAAGGVGDPPLALAACCLCVYLGADVLDNVADRELPPRWADCGPNQAILAGTTLLAALASLALDELDVAPPTRLSLQHALADALLTMAAGQLDDLAFEQRGDVALRACEAMMLAKSGSELAFFARAGALTAGAAPEICDAYAEFAQHLGAEGQLASDCGDIFADDGEASHDLATGKRTLPVVFALETLSSPARVELLGHLAAAPGSPADAELARGLMLAAGALQYGALVCEVYRQGALAALRRADPVGSATALYELVDAAGVMDPRSRTRSS